LPTELGKLVLLGGTVYASVVNTVFRGDTIYVKYVLRLGERLVMLGVVYNSMTLHTKILVL
jgi:hypothetical protein